MTPERRTEAERIANKMPYGAIVAGLLIAAIPYVLFAAAIWMAGAVLNITLGQYVLFAAAIWMIWWMAVAVLNITLRQFILWAVIFAAGYAFGQAN